MTPTELDANLHHQIRQEILRLVQTRGAAKSICPSEVARSLAPETWRDLMSAVRQVGAAMAVAGEIAVTQKGQAIDPYQARGPIRFRWLGPELS